MHFLLCQWLSVMELKALPDAWLCWQDPEGYDMNSYGSWLGAICDIKIANVAAKIGHKHASAAVDCGYVIIRMCSSYCQDVCVLVCRCIFSKAPRVIHQIPVSVTRHTASLTRQAVHDYVPNILLLWAYKFMASQQDRAKTFCEFILFAWA